MFQGNSVAGKGLSPGGTASNSLDTGASLLPLKFHEGCSFLASSPTTLLPSHPPLLHLLRSHHLLLPLRSDSLLQFLRQRRIDNGSSRLSSLFYTHHLTPGRRGKKNRERSERASKARKRDTRNSIDRKSLALSGTLYDAGKSWKMRRSRIARKKNYIDAGIP